MIVWLLNQLLESTSSISVSHIMLCYDIVSINTLTQRRMADLLMECISARVNGMNLRQLDVG
jgi:hypothetical protein